MLPLSQSKSCCVIESSTQNVKFFFLLHRKKYKNFKNKEKKKFPCCLHTCCEKIYSRSNLLWNIQCYDTMCGPAVQSKHRFKKYLHETLLFQLFFDVGKSLKLCLLPIITNCKGKQKNFHLRFQTWESIFGSHWGLSVMWKLRNFI